MCVTDYYIFDNIDPKISRNVDNHIELGDEDGTLATILDLVRQDIAQNGFTNESDIAIKKLVTRLIYKRQSYGYIPKKRLPNHAVVMGLTYLLHCGE